MPEPINDPLLCGGQFRAMLNLDGGAVVMFHDAQEAKVEHLPVHIVVVCGNDAIRRQVLLTNFMMTVAGLPPHAAGNGTVRVEKVSVGHNYAMMIILRQAATQTSLGGAGLDRFRSTRQRALGYLNKSEKNPFHHWAKMATIAEKTKR
ncbi:MAG: hypothetical protein WCH99_21215 [Verrucomicrobiota bacterium]